MTAPAVDVKTLLSFEKDAKLPLEPLGAIAAFAWTMKEALDSDNLDVVKLLVVGANQTCTPSQMDDGAKRGNVALVRFLHRAGMKCTQAAMTSAAEEGHLEVVQFLHFNRTEGCASSAAEKALAKEHVDVMKFLVKHRSEKWGEAPLVWAVENDDMEVVDDILRQDPNAVTVQAKLKAYELGKKEIFKVLYEHGTNPRVSMTLERAAAKGDLETVKYLISKGEGFIKPAMKAAVCSGHLEVVKHIHQFANDQPTSASRVVSMNYASLNGHLDILQYLHENAPELGCSTFAMDSAAMRGHLDIVKFLHENRSEGCTAKAMEQAAALGHLDVVKYLHENRTEGCSTFAMDFAAIRNHPEVFRFLHENRTEGCTRKAFDDTAVQGLTDMVKLVVELRPDVCDLDNGIRLAKQRKFEETIAFLEEEKVRRAAQATAPVENGAIQ